MVNFTHLWCYLCFIREHVPRLSEIWVRPQIKVRIIDKNYKKGKYHKSKVKKDLILLLCMMYVHLVLIPLMFILKFSLNSDVNSPAHVFCRSIYRYIEYGRLPLKMMNFKITDSLCLSTISCSFGLIICNKRQFRLLCQTKYINFTIISPKRKQLLGYFILHPRDQDITKDINTILSYYI